MAKINEIQKKQIVEIMRERRTQRQIAEQFGISQSRVAAIWKEHVESKGE